MSIYSGKCDLYDSLIMIHNYTEDKIKNDVKIYVGNNKEPLKINDMKDLIPYYPHLICMSHYDNVEKKAVIYITDRSFVDIEEQDSLEFKLKQVLKVYNRCKKKNIPFDIDTCLKEVCFYNSNEQIYKELIARVKESGRKATIEGLHQKMHDFYRMELVKEMLVNDINPNDYGYERFM